MEALRAHSRSTLSDAAFDRLVRDHRAPLERYTRGLGASREDAEEIAATALLRAYQHPPGPARDREWRPWLSTVARNLWIDARRCRQLRLVTGDGILEAVPSMSAPVDQIAATAQEARQICSAIALLPPAQRAAIYLREVRGLSYEEIAGELGMTQRTLTTTLEGARASLKQRRAGFAHALSALCSPLALLRRGGSVVRHAGVSGTAVKFAVPVILAVSAGGGVVVAAQHPWTASTTGASGTRPAPTAVTGHAAPAKPGVHPGVISVAGSRRAPGTAPSAHREAPLAPAPSPPASPEASATADAGVAPTAPPVVPATPAAANPGDRTGFVPATPAAANPGDRTGPDHAPPKHTPASSARPAVNDHASALAKAVTSSTPRRSPATQSQHAASSRPSTPRAAAAPAAGSADGGTSSIPAERVANPSDAAGDGANAAVPAGKAQVPPGPPPEAGVPGQGGAEARTAPAQAAPAADPGPAKGKP